MYSISLLIFCGESDTKLLLLVFLITVAHGLPQNARLINISPSEVNHLVQPQRLPQIIEAPAPTIEQTVREVEAMLKANPKLPRLTRGEILDLLENITKSDTKEQTHVRGSSFSYSNGRKPKAIMKVLPFTPDTDGNNVEDLYTKPPVTQIVGSQSTEKVEDSNSVLVKYDRPLDKFDKTYELNKPINDKVKKYRGSQRHRSKPTTTTSTTTATTTIFTTTEPPSTESPTTESPWRIPSYFAEQRPQHSRRRTPVFSTSTTTSTTPTPNTSFSSRGRRPSGRRTTTTAKTTTRYSNHRYEDEIAAESSIKSSSTLFPSEGIKIIAPPSLPPHVINEDLFPPKEDTDDASVSFVPVKDIDLTVGDDEENEGVPLVVEIPEHLKGVLQDLNLESAMKTITKKQKPIRKVTKASTKTTKFPMKSSFSNSEDTAVNILTSLNMLRTQTSTTTATTSMPNIDSVVDTLTPEMKDLLMNFGLIPNPDPVSKPVSDSKVYYENYNPEKAEVKPDSYVGFKRLPDDDNSRDEMQELLSRFGLGRSARKGKALNYKDKRGNMDLGVPDQYKHILDDIEMGKADEVSRKPPVFNPSGNLYATNEEIEKLNNLSTIVQHLENLNRPITKDDFKKIDVDTLKILVQSLNNGFVPLDEQVAPDPLKYDYGLIKNEVKRQKDGVDTTEESDNVKVNTDSTQNDTNGNKNAKDSVNLTIDQSTDQKSTETDSSKDDTVGNVDVTEADVKIKDQSTDTKETPEIDSTDNKTTVDEDLNSAETNKDESTDSESKSSTSTTSSTTEKEENVTPNIKDLEDSFGGPSESVSETSPPETTTEAKRTGFYYLLDWNTFFDMDDQKGRRVNLRFQPKVGDPKRFYSVTVP